MSIGDRIKSARKQCGMTQTELAEAVGTSKQNICKYETGLITGIPFDKFVRLAKVLRVSTDYLAGLEPHDKIANVAEQERRITMTSYELLKQARKGIIASIKEQCGFVATSNIPDKDISKLKYLFHLYDEIMDQYNAAQNERHEKEAST